MISTVMTQQLQRGRETFFIVQSCIEGLAVFTDVTDISCAAESVHALIADDHLQQHKFLAEMMAGGLEFDFGEADDEKNKDL